MEIIIADDHMVVRMGLAAMLRKEFVSAEIDEAEDTETLLNKIFTKRYDLAIVDLSMPGRSGIDALVQIKSYSPDLPVLIFSGQPEEQYALRVMKAGASGFINKDSDIKEIVQAIKIALLGRKHITPSLAEKLVDSLIKDQDKPPHDRLSAREFEVFKKIGEGKSVSEIAEQMLLSATTISTYRARILEKMNLSSNAQITIYCIENKLNNAANI